MKVIFAIALISLSSMMVIKAGAAENALTAEAIVKRANLAAYYAGADGRSEVRMIIRDAQGREQRRQFTVLRKDVEEGGDQDFLVVFSRPSDVRGTAYLVKKHLGAEDDRWLYLPGLDLIKRVSSGDRRTSFVGAHYFYEDVSGRGINEDQHSLIDTTDTAYVLRHEPKDPSSVEFSYYLTWIDRESYLPIKIDYFKTSGQPYRRVEVLETKNIEGHPSVVKSRVSDFERNGSTDVEFRYIAYDLDIPASTFSERSLRRPPAKWLKRPSQNP